MLGHVRPGGCRAEEAASLAKHNLGLPEEGWGELHIEAAEPHARKGWTNEKCRKRQRTTC